MEKGLKVYISVDIEGVTGVVDWKETHPNEPDYNYFRKLMADEVNAAIEGALEAGASEIVVRDAHGNARNLLPSDIHPQARILRNWAGSPLFMMEGISEEFDAALFIGYHARIGTPDATLKHTMSSSSVYDLRINGRSVAEADVNALIAGYFNVPVVFVSGDEALCRHCKETFPAVETVAVKKGIGTACLSLHPEKSRELIRDGVKRALSNSERFAPYKLDKPYTLEIAFLKEEKANRARWYPGVKRVESRVVSFESEDLMDCLRFLFFAL